MPSVIDTQVIDDIRICADETLLKEVVDIFVADVPVRVNELRSAIARRDKPKFILAANSIKGSALVMGAVELQRKAEIIENTGRRAGVAGLELMVPILERSFDEAATEPKRLVA